MDIAAYLPIDYPQALLLAAALVYLYARRLRHRNLWRTLAVVAAAMLLCYPVLRRASRAMDVLVVADRSRSISDEGLEKQRELIDLVARGLDRADRLGIVTFNDRAHIEQVPRSGAPVRSFEIPYSPDASDLTDGLRTALSLVDPRHHARILVLSDGDYTGESPLRDALVAARMRTPVFYRNLKQAEVMNLAVEDVELPAKVLANEPFRVTFRVNATQPTPGRYRVYRDDRLVGEARDQGWNGFAFRAGENVIVFADLSPDAGTHSYRLEVETTPPERETLRKDNTAERFVSVVGERPILIVNNTGTPDNVAAVLSAGAIRSHIVSVGDYRMDLRALTGYKGIVLNNVPILGLSVDQIDALRRFVEEEGGGLAVCGGNRSFQKGGYYKTSVGEVLPVSLEDREESRKVSSAMSIVLDRSGSMTAITPSGQSKMALAAEAAAQCIALLSSSDSVSIIAVDSEPHLIVPQQPVENPTEAISKTRRIESMGGGIFVYNGLVAGGQQVMRAEQMNKHILLFADAADAEQPDDYKNLLKKYADAGITVSVVGLGHESDVDAEFLKDVAARGGGRVYFTENAEQLVQFFTADTMNYTRNSFIEDTVPMRILAEAYTISPEQRWGDFACAGYNLLFARPQAAVAIRTDDDDRAPILAFWQRGLGRVAAIALDPEGAFAASPAYADIVLSAARWVMGSDVHESFQTRVRYEGNNGMVSLTVSDEERARLGLVTLTVFTPSGKTVELPMQWDSGNRLSAAVRLAEGGLYRGVIRAGGQNFKISPMSMPVSPEFRRRRDPDFGRHTMAELALRTGGREVLDVRDLFERRARSDVARPLILPFLIAFLALFLLDIAEARFGMLVWCAAQWQRLRGRWFHRAASPAIPQPASSESPRRFRRFRPRADEKSLADEPPAPASPESLPEAPPAAPDDSALDYLGRTKRAADAHLGTRRRRGM